MAVHIDNVEILSYRGIQHLSIEEFGDINIFVGDNNTGKTSVLEAIQFLCAPNKNNLVRISRQRERYRSGMSLDFFDSFRYMFDLNQNETEYFQLNLKGAIHGQKGRISVHGNVGTQLIDLHEIAKRQFVPATRLNEGSEEVDTFWGTIETTFNNSKKEEFEVNKYSSLRTSFPGDNVILPNRIVLTVDHVLENAFNMLIKNSVIKDKAVKLLKDEFDDTISDLRIISTSSGRFTPVIENCNGEYIPLSLYGDGMKKALTMLNAIINTSNGVVLIDEFETALHTTAMRKVFSFIIDTAHKSDVQLFLTTHSLEALDKLLESAGDNLNHIKVIRLKKKKGKTFSHVMNGTEALKNRKEYNLELRI